MTPMRGKKKTKQSCSSTRLTSCQSDLYGLFFSPYCCLNFAPKQNYKHENSNNQVRRHGGRKWAFTPPSVIISRSTLGDPPSGSPVCQREPPLETPYSSAINCLRIIQIIVLPTPNKNNRNEQKRSHIMPHSCSQIRSTSA